MTAGTPLKEDQHRRRAQRHQAIGDALAGAGDEWAAVPWFYSAYHLIKAAMLRDPIWDNPEALRQISADLLPEDRFTERHQGRRGRVAGAQVEFGINDLVLKLYRPAVRSYTMLHTASVQVRYSMGLPGGGALSELELNLKKLWEMDSASELEAPILWPPAAE